MNALGFLQSGDWTIPLIALGLLGFAIVLHRTLDYPEVFLLVFAFFAALFAASYDWSSWGLQANLPPKHPDLLCGRGRFGRGRPCEAEAPPLFVLLGMMAVLATAYGIGIKLHDLRRAVTLGTLGAGVALLWPLLTDGLRPGLHVSWHYGFWLPGLELFWHPSGVVTGAWMTANALLLMAIAAAIVAAPAVPDWLRAQLGRAREELNGVEVRRSGPGGDALGKGVAALVSAAFDMKLAAREAIRNIRHKGWASAFGIAATTLAVSLMPADAANPALLLAFPAAFFLGLLAWIAIEACLVEPGAWD